MTRRNRRFTPKLRGRFFRVLALCLLVRALIPVGYMPGNVLAGEWMAMCPSASAATLALLQSAHTHTHHSHAESVVVSADQRCPIGDALQVDSISAANAMPIIVARPGKHQAIPDFTGYSAAFDGPAVARGPPEI